jgi:hypothetical protein
MSNLSLYGPFSPGESSMAHLEETISYDTVFYQVPADLVAERWRSPAAKSGSGADAGGSQVQRQRSAWVQVTPPNSSCLLPVCALRLCAPHLL